jgi:hypothetical protein
VDEAEVKTITDAILDAEAHYYEVEEHSVQEALWIQNKTLAMILMQLTRQSGALERIASTLEHAVKRTGGIP